MVGEDIKLGAQIYRIKLSTKSECELIGPEFMLIKNDVLVYPNPCQTTITAKVWDSTLPYTYSIFNSMGSVISLNVQNDFITPIDVLAVPKGTYYIQLQQGDNKAYQTFIKME